MTGVWLRRVAQTQVFGFIVRSGVKGSGTVTRENVFGHMTKTIDTVLIWFSCFLLTVKSKFNKFFDLYYRFVEWLLVIEINDSMLRNDNCYERFEDNPDCSETETDSETAEVEERRRRRKNQKLKTKTLPMDKDSNNATADVRL